MRFRREGSEGHRSADEVLHDLLDGFDFVKRDGLRRSKTEEAAQCAAAFLRGIDGAGVFLEFRVVVLADCLPECADGLWCPKVIFGSFAVAVQSAHGQ